jgi:branched-subunit amino acid transport protein
MKNTKFSSTCTLLALLTSNTILAQTGTLKNNYIANGITFGTALAIAISYTHNRSILWAIIHGIFGWLYVIYFFFTRDKQQR